MRTLAIMMLALAAPPALAGGPTLAIEDTMRTSVPEVLVTAPRVTLDEILHRVARAEARRDSMLNDQVFTFTLRVVGNVKGRGEPLLLAENVRRVYRRKPDQVRAITLRDYRYQEKQRDPIRAEFSSSMSEEVVNFAFRPEAWRDYRYTIAGRSIVGDHVIYEIAFRPRSTFAFDKPSGHVWVDTNDFVILREELVFDHSPAPLILKDIDRLVVERSRVQGFWMLKRVLMRVRLSIPLPRIGHVFDLTLQYDDYALNTGLDDALFEGSAAMEAR